ncbi:MAG: hypothetical protein M1540_10195 [Candidatus Bathyarchaeota archaeon]|nr:hypothetical protein [Candidatus Bathyarchaeota archaeon]
MTKGTPWTVEEELQLKKLVQAKTPLSAIAATLGRTAQATLVKCQRLGLEPLGHETTLTLPLPAELPSVEETLKKLAGALEAATAPGLSKVEVERLQVVATLARAYKDILSDYLNYREVEAKLNDMEVKYAALLESKNNAPQPVPAEMAKTPAQ